MSETKHHSKSSCGTPCGDADCNPSGCVASCGGETTGGQVTGGQTIGVETSGVQTIDLRHVTCGLVPAILDALKAVQGDQADVLVRAGIETEIINGFGTGGDWAFRFQPSFGHGLARFTRLPADRLKRLRLDTLDY